MAQLQEGDKCWRVYGSIGSNFYYDESIWCDDALSREEYESGVICLTEQAASTLVAELNSVFKKHKERLERDTNA